MADQRSEPSMEDILASIKRIIAEDPALPSERPAPPPVSGRAEAPVPSAWPARVSDAVGGPAARASWPDPVPPDSILELTNLAPDAMQPRRPLPGIEAPAAPPPESPIARAAERFREAESAWPSPQAAAPPPRKAPDAPRSAARDLGQTIVNRVSGGDNTLEALVREMLRPMLSDWIDTHVPAMVEWLVQDEIRKMMERERNAE